MNLRYNKILANISLLLVGGVFYLVYDWPQFFYYAGLAGLACLLAIVFAITRGSELSSLWFNLFILPAIVFISGLSYATLVGNQYLFYAIGISVAFIDFIYLRSAYAFLHRPHNYRSGSLENITAYANLYGFFLLSSSFYGFRSFLSVPDWQMVLAILSVSFLILYQYFWSLKKAFGYSYPYVIGGSLILAELSWALSVLPFNYNVLGAILMIYYYSIGNICRLVFADQLSGEKIRYYLIFIIISSALLMLSTRWL